VFACVVLSRKLARCCNRRIAMVLLEWDTSVSRRQGNPYLLGIHSSEPVNIDSSQALSEGI
jgi:hypothetical protein